MSKDTEILTALASGDQRLFRVLYDKYESLVYNLAFNYCKNKVDAEDLTQEVFVKIFKNAKHFKAKSSVSTWIYRITVNASLDRIKKVKKTRVEEISESENDIREVTHPGILLEQKEKEKYLFLAIDALPANQKTAFMLSYIEGLPRKEVAEIMEVGLKAIESLLQRAKRNMRMTLSDIYDKL